MDLLFVVVSKIGKRIRITKNYWEVNCDRFIVTVYTTYKIKRGEMIWRKS